MNMRLRFIVCASVLSLLLSPSPWAASASSSQAEAPVDTPLGRKVVKQRAKVEAINARLKAEHGKLDATIGRIVDIAVGLRDSRESGSMAVQIKEGVIKELARIIAFYQEELARLRQQAKTEPSPAARALWEQQLVLGTALVEARVDQIVRITESLSAYAGGAYLANPDDASVTASAASRAERLSGTIRDAVRKDKERLEKENEVLRGNLSRAQSKSKRAKIQQQISANDALIARRQDQLVTAVTGMAGSGRAAKRSAMLDYNREIHRAMGELRAAYNKLLDLKLDADVERRSLALLEERQARNP